MSQKNIVLDANVVRKWFIEEVDSDKAEIIKEKYINGEIEIIVSPLLFYEVLNALKYSNLFEESELNSAGESLENYGFKVITVQKEIRSLMIENAVLQDLFIYDASYVALSIALDCPLYTADEGINKKRPKKLKKDIISLKEVKG
jgi:predicted nucleic acid-binding protein